MGPHHQADGIFLDRPRHRLEQLKTFAAVLDNRVMLGIAAHADAVAQVVHDVDMVHPLAVDSAQQDEPFRIAHQVRRCEFLLARLVAGQGLIGQFTGQCFRVQALTGVRELL